MKNLLLNKNEMLKMRSYFIVLILFLSIGLHAQKTPDNIHIYDGYIYIAHSDCPQFLSCEKDYYFTFSRFNIDSIKNDFNINDTSIILLNHSFYSGYYSYYYYENQSVSFYQFNNHKTYKALNIKIDEYKVRIFGVISLEDISNYCNHSLTKHEHSRFNDKYEGVKKEIKLLYPYLILTFN